jgi:serine/threonine protein kinase
VSFVQDLTRTSLLARFLSSISCVQIKKHNKPLSEEHIAYVVHEVLLGLDYLTRNNKIHRDIKAANSESPSNTIACLRSTVHLFARCSSSFCVFMLPFAFPSRQSFSLVRVK